MGCDIHMCVEILKDNKWHNIDYFKRDIESGETTYVPIWSDRCYGLFSILANVRNDDNIIPISEPKGLPDDISSLTQEVYDYWEEDAHSKSYLLLSELKKYDKNKLSEYPTEKNFDDLIHRLEIRHNENWKSGMDVYPDNNIRIVFWFDN
jgi:hypothetical protein